MNSEFSKGTSCLPDLGSNTMLIIEVTFTYISKEVFAHIHKVVAYIWKVLACMACIFFIGNYLKTGLEYFQILKIEVVNSATLFENTKIHRK